MLRMAAPPGRRTNAGAALFHDDVLLADLVEPNSENPGQEKTDLVRARAVLPPRGFIKRSPQDLRHLDDNKHTATRHEHHLDLFIQHIPKHT